MIHFYAHQQTQFYSHHFEIIQLNQYKYFHYIIQLGIQISVCRMVICSCEFLAIIIILQVNVLEIESKLSETQFSFGDFSEIADQQNPKHYYYMDQFMFGLQGGSIQIVSHINKNHQQSQKTLKINIIQANNIPQYKSLPCQSFQLLSLPQKSIETSFPTQKYKTTSSIPIPPSPQRKSYIIVLDLCNKNDLINQLLISSGDQFKFDVTFMNGDSHFAQNDPKVWMYAGVLMAVGWAVYVAYEVQYDDKGNDTHFASIATALLFMLMNYLIVFVYLISYAINGNGVQFQKMQLFSLMCQLSMVLYFVVWSFLDHFKPRQSTVKSRFVVLCLFGLVAGLFTAQFNSKLNQDFQDFDDSPSFAVIIYRLICLIIFIISMTIRTKMNITNIKQRNFNIRFYLIGLAYMTVQYTVSLLVYVLPEYIYESIGTALKQICYTVILGYTLKFTLESLKPIQMQRELTDKDTTIQMYQNMKQT